MNLPVWFRQEIPDSRLLNERISFFRGLKLNTVCQEAHCPNIGRCFSQNQATFMILGKHCTRDCRFCAVESGAPKFVDPLEAQNVAQAVKELGLDYVVITSVTRDDLEDGGAEQFVKTISAIRNINSTIKIEVLIPDFRVVTEKHILNADSRKLHTNGRRLTNSNLRKSVCPPRRAFGETGNTRNSALNMSFSMDSLKKVLDAKPDVLGHNIETVKRLYHKVRPQADYDRSLSLLKSAKRYSNGILTKSAVMLGLGESFDEVLSCINDLKEANCDILVLGQYLSPSENHAPVEKFYSPQEFEELKQIALLKEFKAVISGPLVRSSYKAKEVFEEIKSGEELYV